MSNLTVNVSEKFNLIRISGHLKNGKEGVVFLGCGDKDSMDRLREMVSVSNDEKNDLKEMLLDINNILFEAMIDDPEHMISSHPESLISELRRAAKGIEAAQDIMGDFVISLLEKEEYGAR